MVGEMSKGLVATQTQNPVAQLQAKFKELEVGFNASLAKQSLPVEATVVTTTSAAQGAAIGAFMGTLTKNVSSSFPTPPLNAASMNPQAMASLQQTQALVGGPFVQQALNFAVMTGVNADISCVMKRLRGKEDMQSRTLVDSGRLQLSTIGFKLDSGQSVRIPAFPGWSGQIWARTRCKFDESGVGTCQTGDCSGRWCVMALEPHHLHLSLRSRWARVPMRKTSTMSALWMVIIFLSLLPHKGCLEYVMPPDVFQTSTQVAQKSFRWSMGTMVEWEWLDAGVHVRHLGQTNIAAVGSLLTQLLADPLLISHFQDCLSESLEHLQWFTKYFTKSEWSYSYAFDDGTSTFTCKASNYAIIFCPNLPSRRKRSNGAILIPAPPMIQFQHTINREISDMVSSSNILWPIPLMSIIIIILLSLNLFFQK